MTLFVLLLVLVLSTFALVPLKLPFKCGKVVPINQDGFGCACGNSACGSSHSDNPGSLCFVFVPFFSNQKSKQNKKTKQKGAIDFGVPLNTPILAAADGTVSKVALPTKPGDRCYKGSLSCCNSNSNNYVKLNHGDGTSTLYLHINEAKVKQVIV